MADMYYKGHWYGADDREEFLDLIRVGESNVSGNIWEGGFLPPYTVAEAKEAYAMGLYHDRENGRTARKEISVYDAMLAEIMDNRNAEKARVRSRRRADRKYKLTPKMRKEQELMRKDSMYGYAWNLDCPKKRFHPESDPIKTRKYAEGDRIAREDWDKEKKNHADQMRKIRRMDDMVEGISEWLEEVEEWFMDDDICGWTYEDGLCAGAESRIEERRLYKDEIDGYMSESRKMYADEEYLRPVFDMGIRADLYLKSLRSPWNCEVI